MRKLTIIIILLLGSYIVVQGQSSTEVKAKSSFSRESLTKYYKAVVDAGSFGKEDGKYTFGSSFFGITSIFKDSTKRVDTVFLKKSNRNLRNIELDLTIVPMDGNKIKSFTPSIKVALKNNRDVIKGTYVGKVASKIGRAVINVIANLPKKDQDLFNINYDKYRTQLEAYSKGLQKKTPTIAILGEKFGALVKDEFLRLVKVDSTFLSDIDPNEIDITDPNELISKQWEYDKERMSRRSLVTLNLSSEIENGFNSIGTDLVWLKGLNKNAVKKPESSLEVFAKYLTKNDTIDVESGVGERATLSLGANFNRVLSKDSSGDSDLEFKGGFDVSSILNGVYQDEDDQTFNLNFVLSAKLSKDVYLPIEVKWDPINANVIGFLNLTWNFTNGK